MDSRFDTAADEALEAGLWTVMLPSPAPNSPWLPTTTPAGTAGSSSDEERRSQPVHVRSNAERTSRRSGANFGRGFIGLMYRWLWKSGSDAAASAHWR